MSKEEEKLNQGGIDVWVRLFRGRIHDVKEDYITEVQHEIGFDEAEVFKKSPQVHFFSRGYSLGLREGHANAMRAMTDIAQRNMPDMLPKSQVITFIKEIGAHMEGAAMQVGKEEAAIDEMMTKEPEEVQ